MLLEREIATKCTSFRQQGCYRHLKVSTLGGAAVGQCQTMPCASMAFAKRRNEAILAPACKDVSYSMAASLQVWKIFSMMPCSFWSTSSEDHCRRWLF